MKIFVIGGATVEKEAPDYQSQLGVLDAAMERIGENVMAKGHDLVVCSRSINPAASRTP